MSILQHTSIHDLIFIDIETVPQKDSYDNLSDYEKELWHEKRGKTKLETDTDDEHYFNNAAILAEFGKIICISVGDVTKVEGKSKFNVVSFYGNDEVDIIKEFYQHLTLRLKQNAAANLCGHNIKEFDIPYICRRSLINRIQLHQYFIQLQGKKPWENGAVDTMELWKFGDYKNYISLKLLTHCLGIPSPKDDISGKDVGRVYWRENGLERIKTYCEKDVKAVAQLIYRLKELEPLN